VVGRRGGCPRKSAGPEPGTRMDPLRVWSWSRLTPVRARRDQTQGPGSASLTRPWRRVGPRRRPGEAWPVSEIATPMTTNRPSSAGPGKHPIPQSWDNAKKLVNRPNVSGHSKPVLHLSDGQPMLPSRLFGRDIPSDALYYKGCSPFRRPPLWRFRCLFAHGIHFLQL